MSTYTIVGAGAIGAILGVHLMRAGHDVTFVEADAAHVAAVRANGLRLSGALDTVVHPRVLFPHEVQGPLPRVLLAVKARHTEAAMPPIAPHVAPDGFVVSMQNGLEEETIVRHVGRARTIGASFTFGGHYRSPGDIVYGGTGAFRIGELDGAVTDRLQSLQADFSALQPVEITTNIFGFLWGKMALGAAYFATALVSMDVVEQYENPRWLALFGQLVGEVVATAHAAGVRCESFDGFEPEAFDPAAPDARRIAASWDGQRAYWGKHTGGRTGVWRDLAQHKRPTEIDGQVGAVIARARPLGVPVPGLERLYAMVKEVEAGRRALAPANLDELAA